MIRIGNIKLKYGLILAPMAGVTDYAYRTVCIGHGAEAVVSEMISAKAMHYKDKKTGVLARITKAEQPMAVQLFGSEPDIMAEAAAELERMPEPPAYIDINMGCPVHKIVSNGEGSALMRSPKLAGDIIREVSAAVKIPVTVKMRAGWDSESINAAEIAEIAEKNGASAVCVHGRTREQMYGPEVNYEIIAEVRRAVSLPVIANGSVYSGEDAVRVLEATGCDGLMLARGTMGNPWLFKEIKAAIDGKSFKSPSYDEIAETARFHAKLLIEDKGEYTGVREARRHMSYYFKGLPGSARMRGALNCVETSQELFKLLDDFGKDYSG